MIYKNLQRGATFWLLVFNTTKGVIFITFQNKHFIFWTWCNQSLVFLKFPTTFNFVRWVDGIVISLTGIVMCFDESILSAQQLKKLAFYQCGILPKKILNVKHVVHDFLISSSWKYRDKYKWKLKWFRLWAFSRYQQHGLKQWNRTHRRLPQGSC